MCLMQKKPAVVRVVLPILFVAGVLLPCWGAMRADRALRADLLQQAHRAVERVDAELVQTFAGTSVDLTASAYEQLKQQFATLRASIPHCRAVYLVRRKADGTLCRLVDDRPLGHLAVAPVGMSSDEVSAGVCHVFATGEAETAGPYPDTRGILVSGALPIVNSRTGVIASVLCLDWDTRAWPWVGACRAALHAGVLLVLLIVTPFALLLALRYPDLLRPRLWRRHRLGDYDGALRPASLRGHGSPATEISGSA